MFYGLDQVFNILFAIIFFCVLGTMVYIFVKNISTWNKNNNSPRLTVTAKIVAKRTKVFHNQQSDGFSTTTSTSYYVTFEVKAVTGWSCLSQERNMVRWQREMLVN